MAWRTINWFSKNKINNNKEEQQQNNNGSLINKYCFMKNIVYDFQILASCGFSDFHKFLLYLKTIN